MHILLLHTPSIHARLLLEDYRQHKEYRSAGKWTQRSPLSDGLVVHRAVRVDDISFENNECHSLR